MIEDGWMNSSNMFKNLSLSDSAMLNCKCLQIRNYTIVN